MCVLNLPPLPANSTAKPSVQYLSKLESLRIHEPGAFWRLLKPPKQPLAISPKDLHQHYTNLLTSLDASSTPETFTDGWQSSAPPITADEVEQAAHHLQYNKAMGDSWLYAELL